jgi:hypothetical protein
MALDADGSVDAEAPGSLPVEHGAGDLLVDENALPPGTDTGNSHRCIGKTKGLSNRG